MTLVQAQNENNKVILTADNGDNLEIPAHAVIKEQASGAVTFVNRKTLGELTGKKGAELKRLHAQLVNENGKRAAIAQAAEVHDAGMVLVKRKVTALKGDRRRVMVTYESPVVASAKKAGGSKISSIEEARKILEAEGFRVEEQAKLAAM